MRRRNNTIFDHVARNAADSHNDNRGYQIRNKRVGLGHTQAALAQWVREEHGIPTTQQDISNLEWVKSRKYQPQVCETLGILHPEARKPDKPDDKPAQMGVEEMAFLYARLSDQVAGLKAKVAGLEAKIDELKRKQTPRAR
jgi:hypothetical protein